MAIKDIVKFFIFFNMILISCSKDEIIIDDIENNDEISENLIASIVKILFLFLE